MSLADPDEPLVLADGTRINPVTGGVIRDKVDRGGFVEIPSASKAQAIVAKTRRSLNELPVPSKQMNGISLVLFYSAWGLADQDIAIALAISIDQVKTIKELPVYQTLSDDLLKNVLEYESNDIRVYMQQNAKTAAQKIVNLTQEEGALGFAASKDVLDRAGFRPADVIEHKHTKENALRIEIVEPERGLDDIPSIDADYKDITDASVS